MSDWLAAVTGFYRSSDSNGHHSLVSLILSNIADIEDSWLPGHRGIRENRIADTLARAALSVPLYASIAPLPPFTRNGYRRKE